jgi:type 1 fimbria pilin
MTCRKFFALACFALLTAPAFAAPFPSLSMDVGVCDPNAPQNCIAPNSSGGLPTVPGGLIPLSPMQSGLTVASSTALTIPSGATYAVVCARTQNVNYTTDGTTPPTAAVGMQLLANQCVPLQGATMLSNFRAIQQTATATLDVSYFR